MSFLSALFPEPLCHRGVVRETQWLEFIQHESFHCLVVQFELNRFL